MTAGRTEVVACYTLRTAYEREAALLTASLERVGMRYFIRGYETQGSWYDNTRFKADFLTRVREERRGPLLYVDVDAFVHADCSKYFDALEVKGVDFGAHWYRGPAKGGNPALLREEGHRMLSGTLFLGDTPGCLRLLHLWRGLNGYLHAGGILKGGGQKNLWYALTCMQKEHPLRVERIPGRYCYAFDRQFAYPGEEPIIEHTMASRDHRERERRTQARFQRVRQLTALIKREPKTDDGFQEDSVR